ncbi:sigma-54 interaction domain-containing protein [Salsuginibacillus kocurii]|uniref:sigma-54 interaction domain-containing protein n=1 Tax=Salsuginibacillus kocurii TaxID=427078 RepID=UPI00035DAEBB|nr:sigma-54-dependent Fis family transcriptional regulator [Salsuginibacillus kocurii]
MEQTIHIPELIDYKVIELHDLHEVDTLKKGETPVFFHKSKNAYFAGYFDEINEGWAWKRVDIVRAAMNWKAVKKHCSNNNQMLVLDRNEQVLGLLNAHDLLSNLNYAYELLDVFLNTILDTIEESCTVIDSLERVQYWTRGAENLFSYSKEEVMGRNITEFFDSDMLEINKALSEGRSLYRHQHQAREDLVVLINSNPVYLNDKIVGAVVSETDITSQVRMNQEFFNISAKAHQLEKEMAQLKSSNSPYAQIKGNSKVLKKTINHIEKVAATDTNCLILGESGVGKELFAKAVHDARESSQAPFIPVNCGAIPPALFESEIFGYDKGAFSGANQQGKKGKVELAKDGTLFLDEIGEMPYEMQVKLLRVLQEKKYFPVGATEEKSVNFRVVAATNKDLYKLITEGKFREDLYYRINVVSITIPPLRNRKEDILELSQYFLYEFSTKYNKPIQHLSQEFMQTILNHSWPGNVRELRNVIERVVVLSENGEIQSDEIPFMEKQTNEDNTSVTISDFNNTAGDSAAVTYNPASSLKDQLAYYEKEIITQAINECNGSKLECAKQLGVSRATLYNRMKRLHIE